MIIISEGEILTKVESLFIFNKVYNMEDSIELPPKG